MTKPVQFPIITDQQKMEFVFSTDQKKILALQALVRKADLLYLGRLALGAQVMEPAKGMGARDYAQRHVIKNPVLFDSFAQLFSDLCRSVEEMLELSMKDTDDLIELEEQLTSLFKFLIKATVERENTEYDVFIGKIEEKFASSEEKRRLAYKVLVNTCDSLCCLYSWGDEDSLQKHLFECKEANELLAIEIVKTLISKNLSFSICSNIKKYRIKDEEFLIEIAKHEAARNAWELSGCIGDFDIQDQDGLVEIVKIAAAQNGFVTSMRFGMFNIKTEKARVESAKIAFASSKYSECTVSKISNYDIKNTRDLLGIFLIVLGNSLTTALAYFYKFRDTAVRDTSVVRLFDAFDGLNQDSPHSSHLESACRELIEFIGEQGWGDLKSVFQEQIGKITDPRHQKVVLYWFAHFLGSCYLENVPSEDIAFFIEQQWIQKSFQYRDPCGLYVLTKAMFAIKNNDVARGYFAGAFSTFKKNNKSKLGKVPNHAVLPLLLLSLMHAQGVSKEVCDAHFKQVCTSFKEGEVTHSFKDGKYLKIYVNVLSLISKTTELELVDKEYLLDKIFKEYLPCKEMKAFEIGDFLDQIEDSRELNLEEKEELFEGILRDYLFPAGFEDPQLIPLIPCLCAIQAMYNMGKISNLKRSNLERSTFNDILQEVIQKIVPVKPMANFAEKFLQYLDNARVPNYIMVYAATLARAKEEGALEFLAFCIECLLEGRFLEKRYDLKSSLHLKAVFGDRPELFKEWKTGEVSDLAPFLVSRDQAKQKIDFHEFLCLKILTDKHLDPERLLHLRDFLNGRKTSSDALADIKSCQSESEEFSLLSLQAKCIELTDSKLSTLEKMGRLREIADLLKDIPGSNEFKNDIEALRKGLEEQSQIEETFDGYTIVDTDDFQDLALCGTEVLGSCQSINGDAKYCKSLMAYLMNGEIRLLAIKNREGKIVARHILKVLEGGTEPVLFLERGYPFAVDPRLAQALVAFARMRAGKLGLKLLATEIGQGEAYGKPISSLGGLAPYEYSDALGGVTEGGYTIIGAHVL